MLATQGLAGPQVVECSLPAPAPDSSTRPSAAADVADFPTVLCVGSFEPRKNQLALLYAAEVLWRQGLVFRLRFVGGSAWGREFPRLVRTLRRRGRQIDVQSNIAEWELRQAYVQARFSVFTSVHEGYGLPVVESLAAGTPVITSDYGSLDEIAAGGGTVRVDPRDDDQLVAAMRELLLDDTRLARLSAEIRTRADRSWADYATALWATAVTPYRTVTGR
jgi:glycosyltransferase involved in cell wall biosynthesis